MDGIRTHQRPDRCEQPDSADRFSSGGQPDDISGRALRIARIIDRLCRVPGTYIITLVIPTHRRAPWLVEFHRQEKIRSLELKG